MKKLNYIVSMILLICFLSNLIKPFIDNRSGEYFYHNDAQHYGDIFYDNNCYPEGFYWLGYYSKVDFKNGEYSYSKKVNDSFTQILKESTYKSVTSMKSYIVTLISGRYNTLIPFSGTTGAFSKYNSCFNQDTLNYALNTNNKISEGRFVNFFGKVYLIALMIVGNSYDSAFDYEFPNIEKLAVFEIDSKSSDKIKKLSKNLYFEGGIDFIGAFTVEWMIKEVILLASYFIIRPLKEDGKRLRSRTIRGRLA